ncbi:hypothetical protein HERIO_2617 [Hepatospora eriocheir]|nr:hypothetical protein HERIO_2617 [Hepatospora eriocheir]
MWKNYVIDRDLVNVNEWRAFEASDEGKAIQKFKWLLQFISLSDYKKFAKSLHFEKELENILDTKKINKDMKVLDINGLFSSNELTLCKKLKLDHRSYIKVKKVAIECFVENIPLKERLFSLFPVEERHRAGILYDWFSTNKIVIEEK